MHIVCVEDNKVLAKSIDQVLQHEGYATSHFEDGGEAYHWLSSNAKAYDLVILDILLPGMNGLALCKALRADGVMVPILMLTSKGTKEDTIEGLDSGADDYLYKPFLFDELLARIRSLSRRQPQTTPTEVILTPDVLLNTLSRKVFKNEKEVHLTAKEFNILAYFVENPNIVLNQQQIYDHVFDFAEVQLSNTIEVHIKNLRSKLKTDEHLLPITTIRGVGYRYDGA